MQQCKTVRLEIPVQRSVVHPKIRRHDDVVRHEGSVPLLTGQHAATNPRIQEEALQAALVRLLPEAQPRLDKIALVRRRHYHPSFFPGATWWSAPPQVFGTAVRITGHCC
jgi:hypothetical protein